MKLHCPFLSACAVVLTLSTPIAASASASVVSLTYSTVGCTGTPLTNTSYPAGECLPQTGDKAGLSVKTFCTDAYSYAVDYQDAACTTAVAIARVRIGECADGQLTQCLNSAAGPAFPLTFPVDGWTYQTKYFNADHSVASCPLTSSPSAPLSNTQEVSIQLGVCIPRPLKRASAIYACANNGANLGVWVYSGLTCDKNQFIEAGFVTTSCHEGTSVACGPNPLVTPAVPDLGYFECSKKTGAVDETLAILFEPGCLFNTTLSFGCSGGTVTYDVYAGVGCTGGIKKSYSATADGTCDKVWGGAWDCEMGQKFQLSSASQMIAGAWSTMVMAIVLGSRAL